MRFSKVLFVLVFFAASAVTELSAVTWIDSPVNEAAGRLGAFMEGYRYRRMGYLSLISDGVDVYSITLGDNLSLGRPRVPQECTYSEDYNWSRAQKVYEYPSESGTDTLMIVESILAPGFLYSNTADVFRWQWNEQIAGQKFILPLKSGAKEFGEGNRYVRGYHGKLDDNWMLISFAGSRLPFDCPLLFIFENTPSEIEIVNHENIDVRFPDRAGKVIVMPLLGIKKSEGILKTSNLNVLVEQCSRWREIMSHYPVDCRESFAFDGEGQLLIKNEYEFISFDDAAKKTMSPVPIFTEYARKRGYAVNVEQEVIETGYPTNYGPLSYVEGTQIVYSIPDCKYVDQMLAPVKVEGNPTADRLQERLSGYLSRPPAWTWPGDHDYDPDGVMDALHNLRLLAWSTWSLPEKERKSRLKDIAEPGVDKIERSLYFFFEDPVAKRVYARDSTIFAQRGKTSYDSDWYNGFQLAGLWSYVYFGDRDKGLKLARDKWDIFTDLYNYYEIYHDWTTSCATTDPRGNLIDYDCMRNGWSGILAYARLARELGHEDQYIVARYLAAKTMVAHYVQWKLQDFIHEVTESYAPDSSAAILSFPLDEITGVDRLDSYGPPNITQPDDRHPYNLNACIPEHSLFLRDYGLKDRVAMLTGHDLEKYLPEWRNFNPFTASRPGFWSSANYAAGEYFYCIDPRLFAKSIVLNEDLDKLASYMPLDRVSGQAVEGMLVGSRPMLMLPADAVFMGNSWDERNSALSFTYKVTTENSAVEIINCERPSAITPELSYTYSEDSRTLLINPGKTGRIAVTVKF